MRETNERTMEATAPGARRVVHTLRGAAGTAERDRGSHKRYRAHAVSRNMCYVPTPRRPRLQMITRHEQVSEPICARTLPARPVQGFEVGNRSLPVATFKELARPFGYTSHNALQTSHFNDLQSAFFLAALSKPPLRNWSSCFGSERSRVSPWTACLQMESGL